MKCPLDGAELVMSERQGIEIDYCPKCRGVWLDRGELDKIIERAGPDQAPRRGDERPRDDRGHGRDHGRDDDHQYGRKPYRKKKSLLDDLFDF